MAKDVTGSLRKFTVEGISYRVAADANVTRKASNVENEMIPTSGDSMQKKTRVVPSGEGFDLICNTDEVETLKVFAEGLDLVKVTYTLASGDQYRCTGQISVGDHESETGKVTVKAMPQRDWTPFPA